MASSLRTLRKKTVPLRRDAAPLTVADDPLGLDVQARGMAAAREHMSPIGPLPDPRWAGFFQALADADVTKLVAGPSAPGSTQLRGQSLQPRFVSGGTAGDALASLARSMPYWQPPPPPAEETQPPKAPAAPPAPKAPSLPPPTGARPAPSARTGSSALPSETALGSLAAQTGAPGAVTRYGNAYPGAPVTGTAFLPSDFTDTTPDTALGTLQQRLKARTLT
jgi:hypothetical protein